jgi:IS1 family transposase
VPEEKKGQFGYGSVWTWTAIDADTKLVPTWFLGPRSGYAAEEFVEDVATRLINRPQVTTDGLKLYVSAVDSTFGTKVDFAQLIKLYGNEDRPDSEHRYSPAECTGTRVEVIVGNPDRDHINTSFVERQNLSMRMGMRRFTRLTNGFSKKLENHAAALALYFWYYNLARPHISPSKGKNSCSWR